MIDQINDPTDPLGPTIYELWAEVGPLNSDGMPTHCVEVWVCRGADKPWRLGTYPSAQQARLGVVDWIATWHAAAAAAAAKGG